MNALDVGSIGITNHRVTAPPHPFLILRFLKKEYKVYYLDM